MECHWWVLIALRRWEKRCVKKNRFWSLLTFYISPPVFLFQKIPLPRKSQTQGTDLGIFSVTFTGRCFMKTKCISWISILDLLRGSTRWDPTSLHAICTPGYNKQWDQWAQKKGGGFFSSPTKEVVGAQCTWSSPTLRDAPTGGRFGW